MTDNIRKLTHAEISEQRETIDSIEEDNKLPVYVVLDSIRSSYNVGSVFRTSDGAMIKKLFLCGYTPHPPKKDVLKTALGAQDSVTWEFVNDPVEVVTRLKSEGVKICALEQTDKSIPYYNVDSANFPLCIIIGNEISGVSDKLIDLCDFAIDIPQFGIKQSLNVAVAYGITIFRMREKYLANN